MNAYWYFQRSPWKKGPFGAAPEAEIAAIHGASATNRLLAQVPGWAELAATSLLQSLRKRKGALRGWIAGLLAGKPARLVTMVLAELR